MSQFRRDTNERCTCTSSRINPYMRKRHRLSRNKFSCKYTMGNSSSKKDGGGAGGGKESKKLLKQLSIDTHFEYVEVKELYERFRSISASESDDGVIDFSEFKKALGFEDNLFVERMFMIFDGDGNGSINFEEFVKGLSVFSSRAPLEEKVQFSFRIYDIDGNGNVTKDELQRLLLASLLENHLSLSESQVSQLIDATFLEMDTDGDGTISFDEYRVMVTKHPSMLSNMTISTLGAT